MRDSLGNALGFFFVMVHDQHEGLESRHDTDLSIRGARRANCGGKTKIASANFLWLDALIDNGQVILLSLLCTSRAKGCCVMAIVRPTPASSAAR